MIEQAINTLMRNDVDIAALVGTRVFSSVIPQNTTKPAIRFWRVSTEPRPIAHHGSFKKPTARFQIDCIADDPYTAKQVAGKVVKLWDCYKGTVGTEKILLARVDNELEAFEIDSQTYQVPVDVLITYAE